MNDLIKSSDVGNGFALAPTNLTEAMELARIICNTEIVPKDFRGKEGDTLVAMMLGSEVGLNPLQSLSNIAVINGRPSIWGDSMLALCQRHPKFISIKETFDDDTMTATCLICRQGDEPHTVTFSKDDAITAKLWTKGGVWSTYPKRMLQMRARGFALRDKFSDSLKGLISREEAFDIPRDITSETTIVNDDSAPAKEVKGEFAPLPTMSDERFASNMTQYESLINSGKKTNSEVIYTLRGKYDLSDKQVKLIEDIKP